MFCSKSGIELKKYESLCDVLNTRMQHDKSTVLKTKVSTDFKKDDKGGSTGTIGAADVEECDVEEKINSKISSSMRFSLLKKKLAKISIQNTSYENDLKQDAFVL